MLKGILRDFYYRLPQEFQRAVLVKRRERIWKEAGIVFIHIPKAAGTSISEALYGRFMGHVRASDIERWGSAKLKALPSFAVSRNPWDRLVSAYRFASRLLEKDWQSSKVRIPAAVRSQIPQLEGFDRFVTEWLAPRNVCELNQIFQPQSLFVCDPAGNLLVDHLGRLEDIEPTYQYLRTHLGNLPPIERANPSGEPVDYRDYYTPALRELVGQIYADDVRILGYDFENSTLRTGAVRPTSEHS